MKRLLLIIALMVVTPTAVAQQGTVSTDTVAKVNPPAPTVSAEQRLTLQNISLRMQLAEARAALAQAEYNKAREDAAALLATMQVVGYTLDPSTLIYSPAKPKKEPKD